MTDDKLHRETHPLEDHCRQCDLPLSMCACDYKDNGDGVKELYTDEGEAGA
ncbi:MAG: hypothetical protein AB1752_12925 [Candidatus Zixiibacteriota bacterium]